ncbi:hypothetical protein [Sphaerisporangium krabiense]|uniref:DNRLRE domain-containing protein n=1 Tax=Sphaerisporangium krabiense TaxID=763782 RepID=A0A7W8Z0X4_9ACTN|nr:hypothetical protein [Sphaerisporangium krabiense]MBB5625443.1 hypothetical protein [Sphaerisporangium krabiense]
MALAVALAALAMPTAAEAVQTADIPRSQWTYVSSKHQNETHWQEDRVFVGYLEHPKDITRAFFQLDLASVSSAERIIEVWFGVRRAHSSECHRDVEVWETGDISPSTSWKHQPEWQRLLVAARGPFCINTMSFRITSAIQEAVSAGRNHITLGLKSIDETDPAIRHELYDNGGLSVTYNNPPNLPIETAVTPDSRRCAGTPSPHPYVNVVTPTLSAKLTDPDSKVDGEEGHELEQVRGRFEWATQDGVKLGEEVTNLGYAGDRFCVTVPAGQLAADSTYRWRVRAENPYPVGSLGSGEVDYDLSEWTPWQEFTVDTAAPGQPPLVSSDDYPQDVPSGHAYLPGAFTFTPNGVDDIAAYAYTFDSMLRQIPAAADGSLTVTLKPRRDFTNCLNVRSIDRAGNRSPETRYCFTVKRAEHQPTISSSTYPKWGAEPGGGVGIPGEFVFNSGDLADIVTTFRYSYNEVNQVPVDGDGSAKVSLTPTQPGLNRVFAEALDRDGAVVWSYSYYFEVKES